MKKMIYALLVLFVVALTGTPAFCAEPETVEVISQDDTGGSDPSAFEGDSNSAPGERAPEDMPMADAPVDAGLGVR